MINTNQFAAGEYILSVDAEKLLQCFLFAVGKLQEKLVGGDALVEVDALKVFKAVGKRKLLAFLGDERQVKVVAVKMNTLCLL